MSVYERSIHSTCRLRFSFLIILNITGKGRVTWTVCSTEKAIQRHHHKQIKHSVPHNWLLVGSWCVFPPTFNRRLDFSVLPLDLVHRFVLLLLLLPVFELLLSLLSVSLFSLVLVGVLCTGRREYIFQVSEAAAH